MKRKEVKDQKRVLEEDTECWICKRTERDIIAEIKTKHRSEDIIGEICVESMRTEGSKSRMTKRGLITLRDVGTSSLSYPICAICAGLVDTIAYASAMDTIECEKDCGGLLTGETVFETKVQE